MGDKPGVFDLEETTRMLRAALQGLNDRVGHTLRALDRYASDPEFETPPPAEIISAIGHGSGPRVPGTSHFRQFAPSVPFALARVQSWVWTTGSGVRDLIVVLGYYLEELFADLEMVKAMEPDGHVPIAIARKIIDERPAFVAAFNRKSLPEKLGVLKKALGVPYSTEVDSLVECVLSMNQVRNCSEHRGGIVGEKDINDEQAKLLRVKWVAEEFVAKLADGTEIPAQRAVDEQTRVETLIRRGRAPRVKEFKLGGVVMFSAQDFVDLSWTVLQLGEELNQLVQGIARAKLVTK